MKKCWIIGIVTSTFESPFQTPLIDAIYEEAREYNAVVFAFYGDVNTLVTSQLSSAVVDGWIEIGRPADAERLLTSGHPVVVINGINPLVDCITSDNTSGSNEAVQHLLDQGHTQIAFIGHEQNFDFRLRRESYLTTLANAGITADPRLIFDAHGYVREHGYRAAEQLIATGIPFSAIFVASDWLALGVMDYLNQHGHAIPQDVAIVGFDDMMTAQFANPPLSSVRQHLSDLGKQAVHTLIERINNPVTPTIPRTTLVPTSLVARSSSYSTPDAPEQQEAEWHKLLLKSSSILLTREDRYHLMVERDYALMSGINNPHMDPTIISWLAALDANWGMLALCDVVGEVPHSANLLTVVSTYSRARGAEPANLQIPFAAFPPADWIIEAAQSSPGQIIKLVPLNSATRQWGFLIFTESPFRTDIDTTPQRQVYITDALERAAHQHTVQLAYQREHTLSATIRELGCPLIPLMPGVLLVPLIGTIDDQRASQIIESILEGVSREQSRRVLLDITAVPLIDTQVAAALIRTAQAVALLGARITLVGVRPEIAQSIVGLGIDLGRIDTRATLAAALQDILRSNL